MSKKEEKTNVMRVLDQKKIPYTPHTYPHGDGEAPDGVTVARNLGISPSYLSRLFKKETGICLQDYINDVRLERAANLLIYSEESIPKIAEYVNFPSQSYFGKLFKEKMHMTPRQYRESYKPREFLQNITIS